MTERAVVTGIGVASPHGCGAAAFWRAYLAQQPLLQTPPARRGGITPPAPAVAFAEDFPAESYTDRRAVRKCTNLVRLAAAAASLCLEDAGAPSDEAWRREVGVILATTFGSSAYYLQFHEALRRGGLKAANAVLFTESVFNAASGHVSKIHQLRGPSHTLTGGEEVGLSALASARDQLLLGRLPAVLVGGAEQYTDLVHASLLHEGKVGPELGGAYSSQPPPLGEGAALVLLESASEALARGAPAYAEILGAARMRPGSGDEREAAAISSLRRAVGEACRQADLAPGELDLVVGGLQTQRELTALQSLREPPLPYCTPQGLLGEGFAYTSAAQAVLAAAAVCEATHPPTYLGGSGDPGLPLHVVPKPQPRPLQRVLVLAGSSPGAATALVFGPPPSEFARHELKS